MKSLIIINSLITLILLVIVLYKENRLSVHFSKNRYFNKIEGVQFMWSSRPLIYGYSSSKRVLYIPIRDHRKLEFKEDVEKLMKLDSKEDSRRDLRATFSWLKTIKDVEEFEKYYSVVDSVYVKELVDRFNENNTH